MLDGSYCCCVGRIYRIYRTLVLAGIPYDSIFICSALYALAFRVSLKYFIASSSCYSYYTIIVYNPITRRIVGIYLVDDSQAYDLELLFLLSLYSDLSYRDSIL